MSGSADAKRAAEILARGGVVAFPTETVYGLGADASNAAAVQRVFQIKDRPATNPIIVHVADVEQARQCVREWPSAAQKLAERFWPGPLTIVLPKSDAIVPEVTAGGDTVGVRVPDHPVALQMLREFARLKEAASDEATKRRSDEGAGSAPGAGVAAPSANRSSHVSPTTAGHVRDDLGAPGAKGAPDMILEGGPCRVGIESTVISLATPVPTVLRPGGVSLEALREVLGDVHIRGGSDSGPAASPGRQERHYAPSVATSWFTTADVSKVVQDIQGPGPNRVAALVIEGSPALSRLEPFHGLLLKVMPRHALGYAERLYAALREAEALSVKSIWVELPPDEPQWRAVRDRISRVSWG